MKTFISTARKMPALHLQTVTLFDVFYIGFPELCPYMQSEDGGLAVWERAGASLVLEVQLFQLTWHEP